MTTTHGLPTKGYRWEAKRYLFVDASEVDRDAELVVLHLCAGYAPCQLNQTVMHLIDGEYKVLFRA
jgi:hypothetical protein